MNPLAAIALLAFAANSLLARYALRGGAIDPASFTAVRLVAGAATLWLLAQRGRSDAATVPPGRWTGAALLFLYAAPFSFAYLSLTTGTGALILFAAVQLTMIGAGLRSGERPGSREWLGLLLAAAGLVYLNFPGLSAPDPLGAALMTVAGVAWGLYSLRGRRAVSALRQTAQSFLLAAPMALALALLDSRGRHVTAPGFWAALISGALASGGGYAVWYSVLPALTATRAGTVQLAVPVIAALGGVAILGEHLTLRLVVAAVAILGGIGLAISVRPSRPLPPATPAPSGSPAPPTAGRGSSAR
jgi:drug/metabolite transporter (DMT)-like permease